jgi:hypothetical protein
MSYLHVYLYAPKRLWKPLWQWTPTVPDSGAALAERSQKQKPEVARAYNVSGSGYPKLVSTGNSRGARREKDLGQPRAALLLEAPRVRAKHIVVYYWRSKRWASRDICYIGAPVRITHRQKTTEGNHLFLTTREALSIQEPLPLPNMWASKTHHHHSRETMAPELSPRCDVVIDAPSAKDFAVAEKTP